MYELIAIFATAVAFANGVLYLNLRKTTKDLASLALHWQKVAEEAPDPELANALIAAAEKRATETRSVAEYQTRRADEQFKVISDALHERDEWQKLYFSMSSSNAGAQAWLMRELQRMVFDANVYRKRAGAPAIDIDPQLKDVVETFVSEHPAPTLDAARDGKLLPKQSEPAQLSGDST